MEEYRNRIDVIDEDILKLFEERMDLVKKIAIFKHENNLQVLDNKREEMIIKKNLNRLSNKDLEEYYYELYLKFLEVSKKYQERIIK